MALFSKVADWFIIERENALELARLDISSLPEHL
jgi:hypothetical protein